MTHEPLFTFPCHWSPAVYASMEWGFIVPFHSSCHLSPHDAWVGVGGMQLWPPSGPQLWPPSALSVWVGTGRESLVRVAFMALLVVAGWWGINGLSPDLHEDSLSTVLLLHACLGYFGLSPDLHEDSLSTVLCLPGVLWSKPRPT